MQPSSTSTTVAAPVSVNAQGPAQTATTLAVDIAQSVLGWCAYSAAPRLWHWLRGDEASVVNDQQLPPLPPPEDLQQMQLLVENVNDIKTQQHLMSQKLELLLHQITCVPACRCKCHGGSGDHVAPPSVVQSSSLRWRKPQVIKSSFREEHKKK
ncbi:hypothetical protein PHYPSEUDO_008119 [Phytophthora pseudosyringae]|uniref:Uncharacterized protein n=1 Tax=Phytophthora pseudosyringae TaxID=221518 RepID=A0A8T1VEQ2_9STRA|nr:hypothetical protein PHYPSEUDO_008119 [Phytophthora pseudosyringae]